MRWALITLLALCAACEREPAQLVVLVDTDFAVPTELGLVRARITDEGGQEISTSEFTLTDVPSPDDPTRFVVPFSFGVVPVDGDASRRIMLEVDGVTTTGDFLVQRRAVTGFLSESSLLLPMFLARACQAVFCPEGQTCTETGCVPEEVDPASLTVVEPGEELLRDSSTAADTSGNLDSGMDTGDTGEPDSTLPDSTLPDSTVPDSTLPDSTLPDSSVPDASGDGGVPITCNPGCTCDTGRCDATCTDPTECEVTCEVGTTCSVDAQTSPAVLWCENDATCDVNCMRSPDCTLRCFGTGVSCILYCAGSPDCRLLVCGAGSMSCPGDVFVCGRPCP